MAQLATLPQGKAEAAERVCNMTGAIQEAGFANCTNHYEYLSPQSTRKIFNK